jgi:hypothetical protein
LIATALRFGFANFWGRLLMSSVDAIVLLAIAGMLRGRKAF